MAQVKIYGSTPFLDLHRQQISDTIHDCLQESFGLPATKRFHRFIALEPQNFIYPADRSEKYTILEISIFSGRSIEAKKKLINMLFREFEAQVGVVPQDLEITIFETPQHNWGIRGLPGNELVLNYQVNV